ncbi:MAG: DUF1778 domain-containing protein [Tagaea sp.]
MASALAARKRTPASKSAHLQLRVTPDLKALVAEAAEIAGTNVSDFSTRVIRAAAQAEILNRRLIVLDQAAFDRFAKAVENPPPLAAAAKARLRRRPVWDKA